MKEIEVKAKITNFNSVVSKLKEMGCELSEPVFQEDIIFLSKNTEFPDIKKGTNVLRIRNQSKKTVLTLKQPQENELDCIEKEVAFDDPKKMKEILEYLDYHEVIRVSKKRKKCNFGKYKICLDEVEKLGKFIEVEKISEEDSEKVQNELFQFLLTLGIKKEERVTSGYDTLIYHNNH